MISRRKSQISHSSLMSVLSLAISWLINDLRCIIQKPAPSLLTTERAAEKIAELKQQLGSFSEKSTAGLDEKIAAAREEITKLEGDAQKQK